MRLRTLGVLFAIVCLAFPAWAQEQRGTIEGLVRDNTGAVVPGATVEARNIAQNSVMSTVSDASGAFRFPAVLPGQYEVTVSLAGFATAKIDRVDVALGQVKKLELGLNPQGLAENVQVTAEQPLVDVKQTQRAFNVATEDIMRLPRGRDFSTIVNLAPGVNMETTKLGGISFDGASAGENRFIINGAETTNLRTGTSANPMPLDFVQEMQLKSSGYTAEYGGATGGVINLITKSGTNTFRGSASLYFSNSDLEGDARQTLRRVPTDTTRAEYITYPKDDTRRVDPGFEIGGPVLKDRLWFWGGYQPSLVRNERTVTFTANNETRTVGQDEKVQYWMAKINTQVSRNINANFSAGSTSQKTDGLLPNLDGTSNPAADFTTGKKRPRYSYSGDINWVASPRFFLSARSGYFTTDEQDIGIFQGARYLFNTSNIGMPGVPANLQNPANYSNVLTNSEVSMDKNTRLNLQFDGTVYAGGHVIKGGVQLDRIANEVLSGETGNRVTIFWDRALNTPSGPQRGEFGYYLVRSNGVLPQRGFLTEGDISNNNIGLFVQDTWTVANNFTLNLGLRTENERIPSFSENPLIPATAIKFGFGKKLAPRAGFSWDVKGDGRNKVYASWGLFYDITKLEMPRGSFGGDKWLDYWYTLDTPNWPTLVGNGCGADCPGRLIQGPIDRRHPSNTPGDNTVDPDMDPMRIQKYDVGFERQIASSMTLAVRYVHQQIDKAIEDVGALDAQGNEIYTIGNPGYGQAASFFIEGTTTRVDLPKAVRDYDALEVSLNKRFSDNWSLNTSYTLSRLYGNYSGLSQSDENGRTSPNVGRNFDYPAMLFDETGQPVFGRLGTDRPHVFKLNPTYLFNFGTQVSASYFLTSGVPISREAAVLANGFPVQYRGRNSDGRTPVFSQTNLFVSHDIKFGQRALQLGMDVQNLFDQKTAVNRFSTITAEGATVQLDEEQFYRGVSIDNLIAQQHLDQDPRFLKDNAFQDRRVIRFVVRFMF